MLYPDEKKNRNHRHGEQESRHHLFPEELAYKKRPTATAVTARARQATEHEEMEYVVGNKHGNERRPLARQEDRSIGQRPTGSPGAKL